MFNFNATFIIAMFSFVLFIFIMNAIFYSPILSIIRKREDYIVDNYEEAKISNEKANNLKKTRDSKIYSIQNECRKDIQNSIASFRKNSSDKIQITRDDAKQKIQAAKEELQKNKNNTIQILDGYVIPQLADLITSKILGQNK